MLSQIGMLRITTHESPKMTRFQLEGKLAGLWVRELENCWRTHGSSGNARRFCIDLTGVTFIDAAGKDLLTALHRSGAYFVAVECMTKAVIDRITCGAPAAG